MMGRRESTRHSPTYIRRSDCPWSRCRLGVHRSRWRLHSFTLFEPIHRPPSSPSSSSTVVGLPNPLQFASAVSCAAFPCNQCTTWMSCQCLILRIERRIVLAGRWSSAHGVGDASIGGHDGVVAQVGRRPHRGLHALVCHEALPHASPPAFGAGCCSRV